MNLRIASSVSVGTRIMEQTPELSLEIIEAIKNDPKLKQLRIDENVGALICPICYNVIRLTHQTDKILLCECYKCAPQFFVTMDENDHLAAEYRSRMEALEKIAA